MVYDGVTCWVACVVWIEMKCNPIAFSRKRRLVVFSNNVVAFNELCSYAA